MAEKKWWEKTTKEWVNDTLKPAVSTAINATKNYNQQQAQAAQKPVVTAPVNKGQSYGGTNYSNIGTWEVPAMPSGFGGSGGFQKNDDYYTVADSILKNGPTVQQAMAQKNRGNAGGGGISYGYSGGGGGYSAYPGYVSPYEAQLQEVLNRLMNRQPFSYDYMSDPMYQQYAKSYGIQGDLARQDTLGDVASMTGGLPSSYAITAAQQAQNSWNSALNDMIPQLQDAAYQRWMGNYEADANLANLLTSLDSMAYDRYNTDRNYNLALQDANNQARQVAVTNSYSMPEGMSYEEALDWGANNMSGMTAAQQDAFMDYIENQAKLQELMYGGGGLLG